MNNPHEHDGTGILKGLIVEKRWIDLILAGKKTWEMRPRQFRHRGLLALIQKATGLVVGLADIVGCRAVSSEAEYSATEAYHRVPPAEQGDAMKKCQVAWVLENARRLLQPVPYRHKRGAQSNIILSIDETASIRKQDPR